MSTSWANYDESLALPRNRFTKAGDVFLGWSTERYGKVVYTDGETVKNLSSDRNETVILYAVWKSQKYYRIRYFSGYGANDSVEMPYEASRVHALPKNAFTRYGKRFAGWTCSNGRRYDDGMLVFDLAKPGETVTMTAIWE